MYQDKQKKDLRFCDLLQLFENEHVLEIASHKKYDNLRDVSSF